jgi:hypothetical protein
MDGDALSGRRSCPIGDGTCEVARIGLPLRDIVPGASENVADFDKAFLTIARSKHRVKTVQADPPPDDKY